MREEVNDSRYDSLDRLYIKARGAQRCLPSCGSPRQRKGVSWELDAEVR